jgi:outer membrane protein OmpA-like peptidoglycan-associated protein
MPPSRFGAPPRPPRLSATRQRKDFIMRSVRIALTGAMVLGGLLAASGCRNPVAEERDAVWSQNRELQSELDKNKAELERAKRERELRAQMPAPTPAPTTAPAVTIAPAPAPAPAPSRPVEQIGDLETERNVGAGTVTVNLPGDVFFDSGAATIRPAARSSLDKVAAALQKTYAGKPVRVEGHTDRDPIRKSKWGSNQQLSEARAQAVRDYLVKKGVDAGRVTTRGFGADKPRGQDKARNRRVEVVVIEDASAAGAAGESQPSFPEPSPAPAVDTPELNK